MAELTERVLAAIASAENILWEDFTSAISPNNAVTLPVAWLVWATEVTKIIDDMQPGPIRAAIKAGLDAPLLGNARPTIEQIRTRIVDGLKAHLQIVGAAIPAADRVVSLGHNSPPQIEVAEKIDELTELLRTTNEFPGSEEEKDQILGELFAGKSLLGSDQVRVSAIRETIGSALKWLLEKAGGSLVGKAAGVVWDYIAAHWHHLL